jgi:hypothetical protein
MAQRSSTNKKKKREMEKKKRKKEGKKRDGRIYKTLRTSISFSLAYLLCSVLRYVVASRFRRSAFCLKKRSERKDRKGKKEKGRKKKRKKVREKGRKKDRKKKKE